MDEKRETITISNRDDFARWAIERATEIVGDQGGQLVLAARSQDETQVAAIANTLGQAIVDALIEVFDGLTWDDET